jgi:hypothetical protein
MKNKLPIPDFQLSIDIAPKASVNRQSPIANRQFSGGVL